jgi:hypothetical protein
MTKKDYELIAGVLATAWWGSNDQKRHIAYDLADALADTNPLFNKDKFLKACGVN